METAGKFIALAAFALIVILGYAIYADSSLRAKELELKYASVAAGAPLAVCVK